MREHLTSVYKEDFKEDWNRFYNINDFELDLNYNKIVEIRKFCLEKKDKGEGFEISHFLNFIEKNSKPLIDYETIKD